MARKPRDRKPKAPPATEPIDNVGATELDRPVFGQPAPTPDPTQFENIRPTILSTNTMRSIARINWRCCHSLRSTACPNPDSASPKCSTSSKLTWKPNKNEQTTGLSLDRRHRQYARPDAQKSFRQKKPRKMGITCRLKKRAKLHPRHGNRTHNAPPLRVGTRGSMSGFRTKMISWSRSSARLSVRRWPI